MAKRIVVTKRAAKNFNEIAIYLEGNFSFAAAENFIQNATKMMERIAQHPTIGRRRDKKSTLRYVNMDDYRQIYYRSYGDKVSIVDIFDVRQSPDKRPR